ncbi:MAG: pseudouridine synthase [Gammaproteobacteria bacterium]|nr:pseudouridine synthase [Gammaproteobacteria bacterium]MBU0787029.1 pseudouridine synthase [Gammaproteobacteria bacterium]MBU0816280.1 pseudouridine synthase [Gammaproteobacteria bacterium]MBU1787917.1 pseudouridine synthase [Gammaproteobacteria bacterium]
MKPATLLGVSPSVVGLPSGSWPTITDFLLERFPDIPRATWEQRMQQGLVVDEQGTLVTPERPYSGPMRVYYYRAIEDEPELPFEETVLYQDEHLVVADKPHFLPVVPAGRYLQQTLLVRLKRRLGIDTLAPIHRIDRETAGLVMFSVQAQAGNAYSSLFRDRQIHKEYEAIAPWRADLQLPLLHRSRIEPDTQFFRQREVPGTPNSETRLELLEVRGALARYRLSPVSGRTHQLRVHMNALGIPIVGDLLYPEVVHGPDHVPDDYSQPLQLLAKAIEFTDPISGKHRRFESLQRLD